MSKPFTVYVRKKNHGDSIHKILYLQYRPNIGEFITFTIPGIQGASDRQVFAKVTGFHQEASTTDHTKMATFLKATVHVEVNCIEYERLKLWHDGVS